MATRKNLINETSAGAVIFYKGGSKIYYLLLNYGNGYWGFPKGHIEKGESKKIAAKREIFEETGIKEFNFINGFEEKIVYFFTKKSDHKKIRVLKEVVFFLARSNTKKIKLSKEHIGFQWLEYNQAIKRVTFQNSKEILKKANSYLTHNKENTKFKERVYDIVKGIPKGKVLTYKEVAILAGSPKAFRAVGNILNKNKNSKIPCHRVIRSDCKTGGYNKGIDTKKKILAKEGFLEKR